MEYTSGAGLLKDSYKECHTSIFKLNYLRLVSLYIQGSAFSILGNTEAAEQPLVPKDTTPSMMGSFQAWKIAPAPESPPQVVLPFLPAQKFLQV